MVDLKALRVRVSNLEAENERLRSDVVRLDHIIENGPDLVDENEQLRAKLARWEAIDLGRIDAINDRDAENERLRTARACLLAGPRRGDCEHFIGWPEVEDETTTDEWGVPTGWCIVCYWRHKALASDKCRND